MIVLNLKTYQASIEKALLFTDIAGEVVAETGVRIVVCPPVIHLGSAAERFSNVFAQHVDEVGYGAHSGSVSAEMLRSVNAKGSLVNHSEKRIGSEEKIKTIINRLHENNLESLVCAASTDEASSIAHYAPTFIAVEPPELIGSGVSVSKANPDIVTNSVKAVKEVDHKITVLCGAGVSNKEDISKSLELGSEGVLLASAFVKAADPKEFLSELASVF